ncbi:MAG: response regulator [Thermodesulfobacteriota bacterium]
MKKSILIIDDDIHVRKVFKMVLELENYDVDTAETGEDGIKMFCDKKYDLTFLDLRMPGINGVETLKKLRMLNKERPIYIITAFHEEFLSQLRELKENDIKFELANKPLKREEILLIADSILNKPKVQ